MSEHGYPNPPTGLPGTSDELTRGVRVQVWCRYVPERSSPRDEHYLFTYRVRISNEGDVPAQLISRHWVISDGNGQEQHVRGPGVVGEQPRLEPGDAHEYSSFCPLATPSGSMRGTYQMLLDDGDLFDAKVGAFSLLVPQLLN